MLMSIHWHKYTHYYICRKQVGHCHDKNWSCFILTWKVPFLIAGHNYNGTIAHYCRAAYYFELDCMCVYICVCSTIHIERDVKLYHFFCWFLICIQPLCLWVIKDNYIVISWNIMVECICSICNMGACFPRLGTCLGHYDWALARDAMSIRYLCN